MTGPSLTAPSCSAVLSAVTRVVLVCVAFGLSLVTGCAQEKPAKAPCACEAGKGARSGGGGMRSR